MSVMKHSWRLRGGSLVLLSVVCGALVWGQAEQAAPQQAVSPGYNQSLQCSIANGFTLAAVGDLILNQPESNLADPRFQAALKIVRAADAGFGNFEGSVIDLAHFRGYPQAENGGAWLIDSPAVPADLKRMGITIVSRANNHAVDWGVRGMEETDRRLDEVGIVHAGTGADLSASRAAHYLNTAQGRIGIVSLTSRFPPLSRAMDPVGASRGRPGVDALRSTSYTVVNQQDFDELAQIRKDIFAGLPKGAQIDLPTRQTSTELDFFGLHYRLGDKVEITYRMNPEDLNGIRKAIRQGKEDSDFLIVALHTHDPGNWDDNSPDFIPELAHDAIDAGADEFVATGPHRLRGIEIYKGKPIFYSLGNFFFELTMQAPVGRDMYEEYRLDPTTTTDEELSAKMERKYFSGNVWYRSVITVSTFAQGKVSEIRLYPIELAATARAADRGIPRLAPAPVAREILEHLQQLSAPYHTKIQILRNVGIIRPR